MQRRLYNPNLDDNKPSPTGGLMVRVLLIAAAVAALLVAALIFIPGQSLLVWYWVYIAAIGLPVIFLLGALTFGCRPPLAMANLLVIPLLIRYRNGLKQHLSNAMVLAVIRLPRTVLMIAVTALPLIVFALSVIQGSTVFWDTLVFWLAIGLAVCAYINMNLYKGVYTKLEEGKK